VTAPSFSFHAGHPGLDFINTTFELLPESTPVELIGDGRSFVGWLVDKGLLDTKTPAALRRRFGDESLDEVAAEARVLRKWAREWIERWSDAPAGRYETERHRLNRLLERASSYREVVEDGGQLKVVEHRRIDSPNQLLALPASEIANLVATEAPELVKRCAGIECPLLFVDRTKAHKRMYCSPAICGNRAKVAAFRARQRAT
jgi:predicted RNA-binding Zn ribbon-like protein